MIYLSLFWEFFKTGLFSVGGGMATLPFLYSISDRMGWFTHEQLANMIAVSESTPGPIGINMATYVGFATAGIPGAIIASLGEITPGILIVLTVAAFLDRFRQNRFVNAAFYGLRACSAGLIAAAGLLLVQISLINTGLFSKTGALFDLIRWKGVLLACALLVLTHFVKKTKGLHPVAFIALSAVIGIVFRFAEG